MWSSRDARLILPGRTIAIAAHALALITVILQTHDRGYGTVAVAAVFIALAAPAIALMGWAGHLADTHDSRALLLSGIGLQVAGTVGLAFGAGLPATLAAVLLVAIGSTVVGPVWSALLPRVVGDQGIGPAIAWQQGLGAVAGPTGAALGGVLYGTVGPRPAFLVAAAGMIALGGVAAAVRTRRHPGAEGLSTGTRPGMFAGVRIIQRDAIVWPTFMALIPMVLLVEGVNAVEVFLARDTLGATPQQYGLGELAAGVGGVLGAAVTGRLAGTCRWVWGTIGGFAVACAALAVAGAAPNFWVYLVVMVGVAAAAGLGNASNGALVMTRVADSERGRVGAALNGIARTASVVALSLGGLIGTLATPRAIFIGGGLAGCAIVLLCGWPALRRSTTAS